MSGGSTPATTQQVSKVELPPWVNQASQENYQLAKDISGRPLEQYQGQQVAPTSPMTTQGFDYIQRLLGSTDPIYAKAEGILDRSGRYQNQATDLFGKQASTLDTVAPLIAKQTGAIDKTSPLYDEATAALRGTRSLYDKAVGLLDSTSPLFSQATGAFNKAGGLYDEASGIYRGTAGPLDIQPFLNPYTQEVEDRAIANANTALDRNLLSVADKARAAGAFGGSRSAVESAVTRGEGVRGIGDLSAQLRKAGIDFATSTALADRSGRQAAAQGLLGAGAGVRGVGTDFLNTAAGLRDTATGVGNVAAGLQNTAAGFGNTAGGLLNSAAGYGNAAAGVRDTATGYGAAGTGMLGASSAAGNTAAGLLNTAAGRQAAGQQDIANLFSAGQQQQTQQQREIDALMRQFYERRDYPLEGLNTRLAALGMSPYGKTETTNKTATSEDKGPDWASILLGAAGLGLSGAKMFSDRRMKTDIQKVSDGKIPLYSYRYKGDPKTYPKVVGPMAQDIEKVHPTAVKKVGKYKAVDLGNLMEVLS